MKARPDAIIHREQAEYLNKLIDQTDPLLLEMEEFGGEHHVPSADREVARFVEITARATNARRALEIGMAIGYTLCYFAERYRWIRLDEQVYALSYVPFEPKVWDGVWVAAVAILVSFLATIYPARSASRLAPTEVLRYE